MVIVRIGLLYIETWSYPLDGPPATMAMFTSRIINLADTWAVILVLGLTMIQTHQSAL